LPVGVVASVEGGVIRVKPYVERSRLDIVRIVDFGLGGIVGNRDRSADGARMDNRQAGDERAKDGSARPAGG
jgi:rod shape-determining protein MreC